MLSFGLLALLLVASLIGYKGFTFVRNLQKARATGLPYVLSPIHELENIAYITTAIFRWQYHEYLMEGKGWPAHARYMIKDWMYEDKCRAHVELGDVFLVVAPGGIVCYTNDASMANHVGNHRNDFIKPPEKMKVIEPYGPNIASTEGDIWKKHARVTNALFGDAVYKLVWNETVRQSGLVSAAWSQKGSDTLKNDLYLVGINVIAAGAFGRQFDWEENDKKTTPEGHSMTLIGSVMSLIFHLPHMVLLPKWFLRRSPWADGMVAHKEFEQYMHEFVAEEKVKIANNTEDSKMKGNLLTNLVKANAGETKGSALKDNEVTGNLFMFLMAGYDTSAATMIYSVINMVLHPELQDQMVEEIDRVFDEAKAEGRDELTYENDYHKFRYVLSFMYETLRVYPVVIPIGRVTHKEEKINTNGREYVLPAGCGMVVNNTGVHWNATFWPSPETVEPKRFMAALPNAYDPKDPSKQQVDETASPRNTHWIRGSFMGFSEGARACPGRKFAMSEYVCFFAHLLRNYTLKLGPGADRDFVEKSYGSRSAGSPVTLAPPEDVPIVLEPRFKIADDDRRDSMDV